MTGGFDNLVMNFFNSIPNTTRAYRSTTFSYTGNLNDLTPDLYGTEADRSFVLENMSPAGQRTGVYAECSIPPSDAMNLFRAIDSTELPWIGAMIGLTINSTWHWCTDQVIVQRCLAAKNMVNAKGGVVVAMFFKLLPFWLMIMPGMAARVLFPGEFTFSSHSWKSNLNLS